MIDIQQEIIGALRERFGLQVWGEFSEQNFTAPCFSVVEILRRHVQDIGDFQRSYYSFNIQYFPLGDRPKKQCREMSVELNKLFYFFEKLRLWPAHLSSKIVDNRLQFVVDFNVRYKVSIDNDYELMQELELGVMSDGRQDQNIRREECAD